MFRGRLLTILTLAIVLSGAPVVANAQQGAEPAQDPVRTVTLVTGDQVVVTGQNYTPVPAKGREDVVFHGFDLAGHRYVMPSDAASAVSSGRLDERLFDVTLLLKFRYDDASRADLPLIVTGGANPALRVAHALPSVSGSAVRLPKTQAAELWATRRMAADSSKIWLDGKRSVSLDQSVPQIGAPTAWQAGLTGKGMTVAVLDSGIDDQHPDFTGRIAEARNFSDEPDTDDLSGHGTHVASTIAGSGAASGGRYRSVAPDADLLVGKVCDKDGSCSESAILEGFEWASTEKKARVVNFSVGGADTPEVDLLEQAINRLTAENGTLFVVAAGNDGPAVGTVASPSTADAALSVGSVDKKDGRADYSSRGPRAGDNAIKPEIAAPGSAIVAARARNGVIGQPVGDGYTRLNGTSMATPHVAGAAILLAQQHLDWRAAELKSGLVGSAQPTAAPDIFAEGAGRLDVSRAISGNVRAMSSTVNLGLQRWPYNDTLPLTGEVTYHNSGSQTVTLTLSVADASGPDGKPLPAGTFTTPQQVVVPAGGEARVTVSAALGKSGTAGAHTGRLVAVAESTRVITPLVASKEAESYDLTLSRIGRDGTPLPVESIAMFNMDTLQREFPGSADTSVTLRRPRGRYLVGTTIQDDKSVTLLTQPLVDLNKDTEIVLDARAGKPIEVTVPEPTAQPAMRNVGYQRSFDTPTERTSIGGSILVPAVRADFTVYTAHLGPNLPARDMLSYVHYKLGERGPEGDFLDSPYMYHVFLTQTGQYLTGLQKQVHRHETAAVQQSYHATTSGRYGYSQTFASTPDVDSTVIVALGTQLPFQRTEYYLGDNVQWKQLFHETAGRSFASRRLSISNGVLESYQPGNSYERTWNRAPFGPGFTPEKTTWPNRSVRLGDLMNVHVAPYTDSVEGRFGYPLDGSRNGSVALYRNGELVDRKDTPDSAQFSVPPEAGTYRVEYERRLNPEILPLANRTTVAWTFPSAHVPQGTIAPLPLLAVKIPVPVDDRNRARAGCSAIVPINVVRQPGVPASDVTNVGVQVSSDDGATWHQVRTVRLDDRWFAILINPTNGDFVSLRATAADQAGSAVEQTVYRAYHLKR